MKRIAVILVFSTILVLSIFTTEYVSNKFRGVFFQTAFEMADNITAGWNIGNSLESNGEWIGLYSDGSPEKYETAWGNPPTTPELIKAVKEAGFNAIRVPVTWHEHLDENYNIDKEWLYRVQQVVDYIINEDMYCIINVHHDSGGGWIRATEECYSENYKKVEAIWKNIAEHFKNYGDKLIFEGFNEMLDANGSWGSASSDEGYIVHNRFNQLFVDTVRATGGNNAYRNLMLQVYSGVCGEGAFKNFVLPDDTVKNHLIIQVHNYDPQPFTWTSVDYTEPTDNWGEAYEKENMQKQFLRLSELSEEFGVPVIIGECGADFKGNESARKEYVDFFFECADENNIKCFWWDTGAMALFDRNSCRVLYPEVVELITKKR